MKRGDLFLLQLRRDSWPETDYEVFSFSVPSKVWCESFFSHFFFYLFNLAKARTAKENIIVEKESHSIRGILRKIIANFAFGSGEKSGPQKAFIFVLYLKNRQILNWRA